MDYGDDYWGLYRDRDYYRDPFPHSPEPLNLKLYIDSLKGSLKKTLNPQRDPIPKHPPRQYGTTPGILPHSLLSTRE